MSCLSSSKRIYSKNYRLTKNGFNSVTSYGIAVAEDDGHISKLFKRDADRFNNIGCRFEANINFLEEGLPLSNQSPSKQKKKDNDSSLLMNSLCGGVSVPKKSFCPSPPTTTKTQLLLLLVAVLVFCLTPTVRGTQQVAAAATLPLQGTVPEAGSSPVDPENTLSCHRRQYTYRVTETDENGLVCWDYVNIMSCWGRCDSNEIADWKFPYKRSHHPVCLHETTTDISVVLQNCDPGVVPGTEIHVFQEAAVCSCSLCKSSEASCEGLRYRGVRRDPRDTSRFIQDLSSDYRSSSVSKKNSAVAGSVSSGVGNDVVGIDNIDSVGIGNGNGYIRGRDGKIVSNFAGYGVVGMTQPKIDHVSFSNNPPRVKKSSSTNNSRYRESKEYGSFYFEEPDSWKLDENMRMSSAPSGENFGGNMRQEHVYHNFLAANQPIGASGPGVLSSTVEAKFEPNEGNATKYIDDYLFPWKKNFYSEDNFSNLMKTYQMAVRLAGNRAWKQNSFQGSNPLHSQGYETPDNMMKPMIDKKKRFAEAALVHHF